MSKPRPTKPPGSLRRAAAHGVAWTTLQTVATKLTSLCVFLVLARLLSPSAFGLVGLASVFVSLLQIFVEQGFAEAIVQRKTLESGHLDSAFWLSAAVGLVMAGIATAVAGPIAALFGQPELAPILRVLSVSLLISGLASTPEAILRRSLDFRILAMRSMVGSVAGGGVGMVFAFAGYGPWSLVGQILAQSAVSTVALWLAIEWRPGADVSRKKLGELFAFSTAILGINILNFLNRRADDLLIGAVLGATALGYYTVAYRILLIATEVMTQTIAAVTVPTFSRIQDRIDRLREAYLIVTQVSAMVATPAYLALAALAPEIIPVMFGHKWEAAVPVMQILSFIGMLHAYLYFTDSVLVSVGKPRRAFYLTLVSCASNIAAFAIAVHWGIVAVAAGYVIRGYVLSPLPVLMVKYLLDFTWKEYLRVTVIPLGAAAIMVGVLLIVRLIGIRLGINELVRLIVLALLAIPVYWGALRTFADGYVRQAADFLRSASPQISRMMLWTPSLRGQRA